MRFVNDAQSFGLNQDLWPYLWGLDEVFREIYGHELYVTCGRNGHHSERSDHNSGNAVDIRTWRDPDDAGSGQLSGTNRYRLLEATRHALGKHWFVLDEGTHFHLSYRPLTTEYPNHPHYIGD